MSSCQTLTQEELKELLHYDPNVGSFKWKSNQNNQIKEGQIAGYIDSKRGYVRISIKKKNYLAHRLAWLYMYGYFPENDIDHKDQIGYHNWITNLRETSKSCNMRNVSNYVTNTSGVKGVIWNNQAQKWQATLNTKPKKYLGIYKDFDEAVCTRLAAEQCLNWSGCDSNSPAYQYVQEILKNSGHRAKSQLKPIIKKEK